MGGGAGGEGRSEGNATFCGHQLLCSSHSHVWWECLSHFLDEECELLKCAVVVSSRCRVLRQCLLRILNQWGHLQKCVQSRGISDGASGARGRDSVLGSR